MSDESDTSLENACYWHARAESAEADNAILHEKIAHLNYELGVVDYPGKNELVRENTRLSDLVQDYRNALEAVRRRRDRINEALGYEFVAEYVDTALQRHDAVAGFSDAGAKGEQ